MSLEDALVDGAKSLVCRETDRKHAEVSLEAWVDGEATSSRVHTGDILYVVDVLERELVAVVPVTVVKMLSYQCMRLYSTVCVHYGHVHIVNEVH